jgi:K+-transporting ATPase ATPase A chain
VAVIGAVVFVAAGMVQNFSGGTDVTTLAGAT